MKKLIIAFLLVILGFFLYSPSQTHKQNPMKIDFKVWEEENQIKYEWQIMPGGNIEDIRFEDKNTKGILINNEGYPVFNTRSGHWIYNKPSAFQEINGKKIEIEVNMTRKKNNWYGFSVKKYNRNIKLMIHCNAEKCYRGTYHKTGNDTATASSSRSTYYVRTDGGTGNQCTGTVDAPYPGTGANQSCAWSHPFWALNSSGDWKIQGGDTLIIAPGSYMMGYGAPNTSWCEADGSFECDLPPLPSGPNASNPTRILGKGWNSGCYDPPELWGTQRPWQIIDLTGSSNIYIGCLEITDHSSCVEDHSNPSVQCERNTYPYGDWASDGIIASDSSNVILKNLDIHGLGSAGIRVGRISDWTVEDVRIAGNGWVGWEGDIEFNDSNSGTIHFKDFIVEWNGCGETYPGGQPHNCWAQTAGGYGDGLGTGKTGGHWIFEDSIFRYNTSDGLDLLWARNSGSQIEIKRTMSYGNAGNPIKVNGTSSIENCLMVGNCGFFNGKSFTYNVDDCRAGGNSLELNLRKGITVSVINSTIVGQGDCLVSVGCDENVTCDGSETIIMQNNILQGYNEFLTSSDTTCYIWFDQDNFYTTQIDYNIVYDAKIGVYGLSTHDINQDPLFVNDNFSSFDGHLQSNSPAIDSGLAVGSLNGLIPSDDIEGNSRPHGAGVDRGAYEYGSGGSGSQSQIDLNRTQLYFGACENANTGSQTFLINNSGSGTLSWSTASNKSWLRCTPTSGINSGEVTVTVDPSGLSSGTHTGAINITGLNASNSPQTVYVTLNIYSAGSSSSPFGIFATPSDGSTVRSSIPVTGWVLDDIELSSVKIYRKNNGELIPVGDAVFVDGARPDVEQAYPEYPMNYKAGWGYMMLTNFLPNGGNGIFTFQAIAKDKEGNQVTLGIKTITVDNSSAVKPFGAIDTPTQGGTASGSNYRNQGWVLTPIPNTIPTDGSTINVYVDGVNLGHPTYNIYRADIAGLFPGYANSGGAHAYFDIDTTADENGVHTIQWTAADGAGNTDGIGSRYFTIQNSQSAGRREQGIKFKGDIYQIPIDYSRTMTFKKGYNINSKPVELYPNDKGKLNIEIRELEHLEIHLSGDNSTLNIKHSTFKNTSYNLYAGYLLIGSSLKKLPIGSTIDRGRGIFYWQPGPGFLGEYRLVFLKKEKTGEMMKKIINIKIIPKF